MKSTTLILTKGVDQVSNIIETAGLTKWYGKSRGIIDVNLSIKEGDLFGFIGPNGAGKSTTIRLLLGLIRPTGGKASIFGMDCCNNSKEILVNLGYMPSEAQFYNQMKVEEIIKLAADLHRKDCKHIAKDLCDRFQLDIKKKVEDLSLGNRKKVSIICALQHEPDLVILDEPTSGLDPLMQQEFFKVLEERNKKGVTIFFSSHVLPEIQNHCKNAAIIREGELIKVSSVSEMTKTSAKIVTLHGISSLDDQIEAYPIETTSDSVRFLYKGNVKELITSLNQYNFTDLTITEPSLEEIFMHFYE